MDISMLKQLTTTLALTALLTAPALAGDYKVGSLTIDHPVMRATAPGAKVGGGFLTIENTGKNADRLVGGSVEFAKSIEIHEMKMENDVMKMRQIPGGLEIAPGKTEKLKPGGNHVMFMGLKEQLKQGEQRKVTLTFEKAGSVDVVFQVKSIAETMKMKMKKEGE